MGDFIDGNNGAPPQPTGAVLTMAITLAILSNKILNYKKWGQYSKGYQEEYLMRKLEAFVKTVGAKLDYFRFEDCENTSTHLHGVISSNLSIQEIQTLGNEFFKTLHLRGAKHTQPFLVCEHFYEPGWTKYINKQDVNPINMFL